MSIHKQTSRVVYCLISLIVLIALAATSCTLLPIGGARTPPRSPLQIDAINVLDSPLVNQPFRVEIPITLYAEVPISPVILTLTLPSSLDVVDVQSAEQVTIQRDTTVYLQDPVGLEGIETQGLVLTIELGTMGATKEEQHKVVTVTLMVTRPGEWQIETEVMWRDNKTRNAVGDVERLVGWSTPNKAVWEDLDVVQERWSDEVGRQCRGQYPCLVVLPEEPLHYFLGISEKDMSGQSLRPRSAQMCDNSIDLSDCMEQNEPQIESPTPESPVPDSLLPRPTGTPPPPLVLGGRITFIGKGGEELALIGALVQVWDKAIPPLECPPPIPTPPPRPGGQKKILSRLCEDTLLAEIHTQDDGSYQVSLQNIDRDGTGLDPYIIVYATDQTSVVVRRSRFDPPYSEKSDLIARNSRGGKVSFDMSIKKPDLSRAFYIYDQIRRVGYGGLQSQVGWTPSRAVTVYWPQRCVYVVEGACYYNGALYVPQKHFSGQIFDDDVLLHEFGHFVMSQVYGNNNYVIYACPGFAHFLNAHETKRCAWSEGWATFLQAMLQNEPNYVDNVNRIEVDLEFPTSGLHLPPLVDPPISNADNETAVAAILWDMMELTLWLNRLTVYLMGQMVQMEMAFGTC